MVRRAMIFGFYIATMVAAACSAALTYIDRFVAIALDVFRVEPQRFLSPSHAFALDIDGHAYAPELLQGLRHEAGVSRRSAARHT